MSNSNKTPTTRVKNVQTPGEAQQPAPEADRLNPDQVNTGGETAGARAADVEYKGIAQTDELDAQRVNMVTTRVDEPMSPDGIIVAGADSNVTVDSNGIPEDIMERARAQVHAELGADLAVAARKLQPTEITPAARRDYRNMRASEIDPATLTAPVFTLDGWMCPPAAPTK